MDTGPMHAVLQHLRQRAAADALSQLADGQLLERFLNHKEEAAFAALMQRHGPMVWRVCHRVLRHRQNAEDVFQATFLTLTRKAGSIRKLASVSCWLHGVAYRLARRLQQELSRPCPAANPPSPGDPSEQASGLELQAVLDDELARLPTKHRLPLVLCFLQGKTRDEAAHQLGWSLSTLKRRLERGRNLLAARLERRGLSLGIALVSAALSQDAVWATVPPTVFRATCQAAGLLAAGQKLTGIVSAQVAGLTEATVRALLVAKLKLTAAVLLLVLAVAGGMSLWAAHQPHARPGEATAPRAELPADTPAAQVIDAEDRAALIRHGDYLVNQVARCAECHTPRLAGGSLDPSRHLQGAPLWFAPRGKLKREWEDRAPDITAAGRAGKWSEERLIKFLTSGGKSDLPMPAYRLSVSDARAVTAYLRSLPGQKKSARGRERDDD